VAIHYINIKNSVAAILYIWPIPRKLSAFGQVAGSSVRRRGEAKSDYRCKFNERYCDDCDNFSLSACFWVKSSYELRLR